MLDHPLYCLEVSGIVDKVDLITLILTLIQNVVNIQCTEIMNSSVTRTSGFN